MAQYVEHPTGGTKIVGRNLAYCRVGLKQAANLFSTSFPGSSRLSTWRRVRHVESLEEDPGNED